MNWILVIATIILGIHFYYAIEVPLDSYPSRFSHVVDILIHSNGVNYTCSGSLIDGYWVLTAADCVTEKNVIIPYAEKSIVCILKYNKRKAVFQSNITKLIIHEHYDPISHNHDIALIKLNQPVPLMFASSIQLTENDSESDFHGNNFTTIILRNNTKYATNIVLEPREECNIYIFPKHLCTIIHLNATNNNSNNNTLKVDHGSALMRANSKKQWLQFGITLYTRSFNNSIIVHYTSIPMYNNWISLRMLEN